jgi:hypothetical protein
MSSVRVHAEIRKRAAAQVADQPFRKFFEHAVPAVTVWVAGIQRFGHPGQSRTAPAPPRLRPLPHGAPPPLPSATLTGDSAVTHGQRRRLAYPEIHRRQVGSGRSSPAAADRPHAAEATAETRPPPEVCGRRPRLTECGRTPASLNRSHIGQGDQGAHGHDDDGDQQERGGSGFLRMTAQDRHRAAECSFSRRPGGRKDVPTSSAL